jgi:hypothetical protein
LIDFIKVKISWKENRIWFCLLIHFKLKIKWEMSTLIQIWNQRNKISQSHKKSDVLNSRNDTKRQLQECQKMASDQSLRLMANFYLFMLPIYFHYATLVQITLFLSLRICKSSPCIATLISTSKNSWSFLLLLILSLQQNQR